MKVFPNDSFAMFCSRQRRRIQEQTKRSVQRIRSAKKQTLQDIDDE